MSKENIQTKLICLKDSGLSLDECQFTGRLEFHDTHSIASLVSNTTCVEIMATEIFLNFDKEIDEFFLFSLFTDNQRRFPALKRITVSSTNQFYKDVDGILYTKDGEILIYCPSCHTGDENGEMHIPNGVKYISPKAFAHNTGIKELYLPDSLKMIFESAFLDMNELQFVDFGKGIRHIGSENSPGIFRLCRKLEEIIITEQVKSIGPNAFYDCSSLQHVNLPEGLEYIAPYAFYDTGIKTIHLPTTLYEIGKAAISSADNVYIDRSVNNPSGLIQGVTFSYENYNGKPKEAVVTIHDKGHNTYYFPKVWAFQSFIDAVRKFCDSGMMYRTNPDFVIEYLDLSTVKYDILSRLYRDSPKNNRVLNEFASFGDSVIDRYLNRRTFRLPDQKKDKQTEKMICEMMSLGIVSFEALYYLYQHALKEDNSEMIAYALSSANKFYPDESLNEAEDMNI